MSSLFIMDILKQVYDKVKSLGNFVVDDVGDVFYHFSDLDEFCSKERYSLKQIERERMRELETRVINYETNLTAIRGELDSTRTNLAVTKDYLTNASREVEDLRNLAQHLKVQNREVNHRRFAAEKNVGAFDVFMRSRVCELIEKGINPLNGESKGCYAFIDRHSNVLSLSYAARKVLGYDESEVVDYHSIVSVDKRTELTDVRNSKTIKELSLKIAEGVNVIVRDVHVSPIIVGNVYGGSVVDFRGLSLIEKARVAWIDRKARGLIGEICTKFKSHKSDTSTKKD